MNKININKLFAVVGLATILTSCAKVKDFGSTNISPNGTLVPSTAALLTNAEIGIGAPAAQSRGGLYCQYFSETQYTDVSLYATPQLNFDGNFAGAVYDCVNIIKYVSDSTNRKVQEKFGSYANQIAVARILKAYYIWNLTDLWGDIPYTQAFQGDANLTPAYDSQKVIYLTLIKELVEAKNQFDGGAMPTGDVLYAGSSAKVKWKKLANSLRMLIALRMSKVYPGSTDVAATEFKNALADADGSISTNSDNLVVNYTGSVTAFKNPWYNTYDGRNDYAESKPFSQLLTDLNDTRNTVLGTSADPADAFPYGLTRDNAVLFLNGHPLESKILASSKKAANSPLVVINSATVLFARAEAAALGWTSETAKTLYETAITNSFSEWGLTIPGTYLAQAAVVYDGSNSIKKIATQRYIALYPNGSQGWSEWRRTGFPALTPTPNATNSGKQIPRRYTYGTNEYTLNAASVAAANLRLSGGDIQDARIWWDK